MNIDDLYFGVMVWDFNKKTLEPINLFNFGRVRFSVANYVVNKNKLDIKEPLRYCFGDVWGRVEYEYMVNGMVEDDDKAVKIDVYSMYVEPNARLLMEMVNSISEKSAKKEIKEFRKLWRR